MSSIFITSGIIKARAICCSFLPPSKPQNVHSHSMSRTTQGAPEIRRAQSRTSFLTIRNPDKLEQARILYLHSDKTAGEVCRTVGIAQERSRQSDFLPLPDAQFLTVLEPLAQHGVVAVLQPSDELVGAGLTCRCRDPYRVEREVDVPKSDILQSRQMVPRIVLEHH
jgi:hypothetical protein